jgi:hypothetical protein
MRFTRQQCPAALEHGQGSNGDWGAAAAALLLLPPPPPGCGDGDGDGCGCPLFVCGRCSCLSPRQTDRQPGRSHGQTRAAAAGGCRSGHHPAELLSSSLPPCAVPPPPIHRKSCLPPALPIPQLATRCLPALFPVLEQCRRGQSLRKHSGVTVRCNGGIPLCCRERAAGHTPTPRS